MFGADYEKLIAGYSLVAIHFRLQKSRTRHFQGDFSRFLISSVKCLDLAFSDCFSKVTKGLPNPAAPERTQFWQSVMAAQKGAQTHSFNGVNGMHLHLRNSEQKLYYSTVTTVLQPAHLHIM